MQVAAPEGPRRAGCRAQITLRPENGECFRLDLDGTEAAVSELHRGSLAADTAAVQAVTDALPEPPVVLGHSYGGSVITGVRGVADLIYLAAFVPDADESAAGLGGASEQLKDVIVAEPDGSTALHPGLAIDTLYGDCPEPLAAQAAGLQRTQAPGCGRGVPPAPQLEEDSLYLRHLRTGPGHRHRCLHQPCVPHSTPPIARGPRQIRRRHRRQGVNRAGLSGRLLNFLLPFLCPGRRLGAGRAPEADGRADHAVGAYPFITPRTAGLSRSVRVLVAPPGG